MKKFSICVFVLLYLFNAAKISAQELAIIPKPVSIIPKPGAFKLTENMIISHPNAENSKALEFLKNKLIKVTGKHIKVMSNGNRKASLKFELFNEKNQQIGDEGYVLIVKPSLILIKANKESGLFYGVQTLLQLLPKEIESKKIIAKSWTVPCLEILDYPKLSWRGLMLDVSRHFFTKEEVKQYIDAMVRYKFNMLHLHLTDNEGWRIEIKKYPLLTKIGAWRVKKEGNFGTFKVPLPHEPKDYGGFYTQDDIKELVAYAGQRFVQILPEIDVPGHSLAAVAAYPELSCSPEAKNYQVRSGEKIMDWSAGGPLPKAIYDNNLCPANENVFQFLDDIITELALLFPFPYLHMGGDETSTNFWEKSPAIKSLMEKEKLKDMHEVQGYFSKRVKKLVENKGKKLMGWDEILTGGLTPDAAVMVWRDTLKAVNATLLKHQVVMSPFSYTYLDLMQGDAIAEPPVYKELRLSKAYQFNPIPKEADVRYILGGQANLWTEQVYNIRHAEYMTWPRGFAISEALWCAGEAKNWPHFFNRVEKHFERFDQSETKYAKSVYDPIFIPSKNTEGNLFIVLETEVEGLDIYYSFDNSFLINFILNILNN